MKENTLMSRKILRAVVLCLLACLTTVYLRLWVVVSSSTHLQTTLSTKLPATFETQPLKDQSMMIGRTKIVGFCNYNFRSVGVAWYERMSKLGYTTHVLVATDPPMARFLATKTAFRYEVMFHEKMPVAVRSKPKSKQDHAVLELLMAVRWKYLLQQLQQGIHVLLTDVDNIFTQQVPMEEISQSHGGTIDVWHAYATKYPRKAYSKQKFVVCSGMSWWRASPASILFSKVMHEACGIMCDDQRVLNDLLVNPKLDMVWNWTEETESSIITNATTQDPRFLGLPTLGIAGRSKMTSHTARIWDRDFAFRGPLRPETCPENNWVSMPILEAKSRGRAWMAKIESFDVWDRHCGGTHK